MARPCAGSARPWAGSTTNGLLLEEVSNMRSIPHFSSAAHLTLAVMLATAMCIPLHAYADGSDEGAPGTSEESGNAPDASEGPADSSADQQDSSDDSADQKAQGSASDAGSENAGAPLATELGNAAPNAPLASPAPAAAGALTMQQGDGEAKSYDSFAAAMASSPYTEARSARATSRRSAMRERWT